MQALRNIMGNSKAKCQTPFASIYEISANDIDGNPVSMQQFEGKLLLITNVASKCGMTDQYFKDFKEIYEKYKPSGFEILAFPCNQFFHQEPKTNKQIKEYMHNMGVTFPVFEKIDVNGTHAHDLFKYLRYHSRLQGSKIGWNFGKFLVGKDGKIINYYGPRKYIKDILIDIESNL